MLENFSVLLLSPLAFSRRWKAFITVMGETVAISRSMADARKVLADNGYFYDGMKDHREIWRNTK